MGGYALWVKYERARTTEEKRRRMRVGLGWGLASAAAVLVLVIPVAFIVDGDLPDWSPWAVVIPVVLFGVWLEWREGTRGGR